VSVRASDADRQRIIDALQRHTAAGRLTLDEFSERVGGVFAARTLQDLAATTADLPPEASPAADQPRRDEPHAANARQLGIAFAVAVLAIVILGLLYTLAH
jgi:hypothetical protein